MTISLKRKNEAFDILKNYEGDNPYMLTLQKYAYVYGDFDAIGDFQAEFILKNHNQSPVPINRIFFIH